MSSLTDNQGLYVHVFELTEDVRVEVGALGEFEFDAGLYAYVGSAKQYLRQRVDRHMRSDKPTRWHIDYLTTLDTARPRRALLFGLDDASECGLSAELAESEGALAPIGGFGASDCTAGCEAHLWRLEGPSVLDELGHEDEQLPGRT
ncbi:MAG: GIY-YIG nuclease family protein [Myxococcota bacterium]